MTAAPHNGVRGGVEDRPGQDAPAGHPAPPRVWRAQWRSAVLAAPDLSATRKVQALTLAVLMTADGELEAYAHEIGAVVGAVGSPLSGRTVSRLLATLMHAGLLRRLVKATPAGPPVFLARLPGAQR
jgi:hypothetical protein